MNDVEKKEALEKLFRELDFHLLNMVHMQPWDNARMFNKIHHVLEEVTEIQDGKWVTGKWSS